MNRETAIQSPHLRTERTTRNIMIHVSIALMPALAGAVYFFGIRSLYLTALSVITCVLTEFLWQKFTRKQVTVNDFSAVVTGILLAFNMPVTVPEWVLILSAIFSILFVKQMFGGIGGNFVNPALMGRLFTMVVWPGTVMQYTAPVSLGVDAVSSATVLGAAKTGSEAGYSYLQMFLGEIPGALGETSKLLLLAGFAYMCYIGIVNIEAAFTYAATVLILTFVFGPEGLFTGDILLNLFGGGLILGACYMLTDYAFVSRRGTGALLHFHSIIYSQILFPSFFLVFSIFFLEIPYQVSELSSISPFLFVQYKIIFARILIESI